MSDTQQDLFEKQINHLAGEEIVPSADTVESELRSSYLRHSINGVTLVDTAVNVLEQARRNFNQALRVAALFNEGEQLAHADAALAGLDEAIKEAKKITRA